MRTAIVFPDDHGIGFSVGWLIEAKEPYCLRWGNCETREIAASMLQKEYPGIAIVQAEKTWPRIAPHSTIHMESKV
jgi:hypothetical protein